MSEVFSHSCAALGADVPASSDPLAPLIEILDKAHRELGARDLAGVLADVDELATAMLVAAITSEAQQHRVGMWTIGTGPTYRVAAGARLDERNRAAHRADELARCARRLHAYVEDVAAHTAGLRPDLVQGH